jgi:hypothetical protein
MAPKMSWQIAFQKEVRAIKMFLEKPLEYRVWNLKVSYLIILPKSY